MEKMKPSGRTFAEKSFIEANGYVPTVEDAIRLTEEAREEIRRERQKKSELAIDKSKFL